MYWLFFLFLLSACGAATYQTDGRFQDVSLCPKQAVSQNAIDTLSQEVQTEFPIHFSATEMDLCEDADISCEQIPFSEYAILEFSLGQLKNELRRYPNETLTASGLKNVVFMKRLTLKGRTVGGIASGKTLFMNTHVANCGVLPFREVLHHEFFHIMDARLKSESVKTAWVALNPPGFGYLGYEKGLAFNPSPGHEFAGFVTEYSMTAWEEDRAEIFKTLMIGAHARQVRTWTESDSYLSSKVNYLKTELEKQFGAFSSSFWNQCEESD